MMRRMFPSRLLVGLVLLAASLAAGPATLAANDNPGVLPPNAHAFGKTYEAWSTAWWRWVYSLPVEHHPLVDTGDVDCSLGQQGKVWFLGGIFSTGSAHGTATRTCSIPTGTALFLPILNQEFDNITIDDQGHVIAPTTYSEQELDKFCTQAVANPDTLAVTLDGTALQHLDRYAIKPTLFSYTAPDDSIYDLFGIDFSGKVPAPGAVSCGYYVLFAPLAAGAHTLRIEAATAGNGFSLDVTYHLAVEGGGRAKH